MKYCSAGVTNTIPVVTTQCEFYNATCNSPGGCNEVQICENPGEGKRNHCYVVWSLMEDGTMNITLKVTAF